MIILHFFIAASCLHGFVIATFLFKKRGDSAGNRYLSALVCLYALDLAIENALIAPQFPRMTHLIGIIDPFLFAYGPLLFLYARHVIQKPDDLWQDLIHFLPFLVVLALYALLFYPLSGDIKWASQAGGEGEMLATAMPRNTIWLFSSLHECFYVWASLCYVKRYQNQLKTQVSTLESLGLLWLEQLLKWTLAILAMSFLVLALAYWEWLYWDEAVLVLLILCAHLIYFIGYKALSQPQLFGANQPFLQEDEGESNPEFRSDEPTKYAQSGFSSQQSKALAARITQWMHRDKRFLQPDLRLRDLAEAMAVSDNQVSQAINENFDRNFYQWINGFRVDFAKSKLATTPDKILDIAMDSGFNSKSSFNAVFKKITGISPGQYRKSTQSYAGETGVDETGVKEAGVCNTDGNDASASDGLFEKGT